MLSWVVTFLIIALIAGILGFGGIAGASIEIANLLYRGGAVPGLRRGRSGAGPNPHLKAERYFEGIATFLPMPSGRGTVLWAFANVWMRV